MIALNLVSNGQWIGRLIVNEAWWKEFLLRLKKEKP